MNDTPCMWVGEDGRGGDPLSFKSGTEGVKLICQKRICCRC